MRDRAKRNKNNKMKFNWFSISQESFNKWEDICPPNEFRVISGSSMPSLSTILPPELTNKYHSVVIAGSPVGGGTIYYMANGNRIDASGSAIDQMPFGLAFVDQNASGSACLIQHGDYENRTTHPPVDFWEQVRESGIYNYYPLQELPKKSAGKLSELNVKSQLDAFEILRSQIEPLIEKGSDSKDSK